MATGYAQPQQQQFQQQPSFAQPQLQQQQFPQFGGGLQSQFISTFLPAQNVQPTSYMNPSQMQFAAPTQGPSLQQSFQQQNQAQVRAPLLVLGDTVSATTTGGETQSRGGGDGKRLSKGAGGARRNASVERRLSHHQLAHPRTCGGGMVRRNRDHLSLNPRVVVQDRIWNRRCGRSSGGSSTPLGLVQAALTLRISTLSHQTGQANVAIPWALTKDEKKRYDQIFRAWDKEGTGYIGGAVAKEVFGQAGLDRDDLMAIWCACRRRSGGYRELTRLS